MNFPNFFNFWMKNVQHKFSISTFILNYWFMNVTYLHIRNCNMKYKICLKEDFILYLLFSEYELWWTFCKSVISSHLKLKTYVFYQMKCLWLHELSNKWIKIKHVVHIFQLIPLSPQHKLFYFLVSTEEHYLETCKAF